MNGSDGSARTGAVQSRYGFGRERRSVRVAHSLIPAMPLAPVRTAAARSRRYLSGPLTRSVVASLLALASALLLAACHQAPAPTPEIEPPVLERRTVHVAPAATGRILSVPKDALQTRAGVPGVFVYRQGRARFQMVKTGRAVRDSVEILSGLMGGETLVVGDLKAVHDGSPVEPLK